jgi:hypothetical protein
LSCSVVTPPNLAVVVGGVTMTPKDIENVTWVKKNRATMSKGGSSCKYSGVLYFILVFHFPKACQV